MHLWYPSSKKKYRDGHFSFFRVSLSANVDCTLPRSIPKEALPFSPMTQKGDLQFLIFLKSCII